MILHMIAKQRKTANHPFINANIDVEFYFGGVLTPLSQ